MKKIVSINLGNFGSTGMIMRRISGIASEENFLVYKAYPATPENLKKDNNDIIICSDFARRVYGKLSYYTGINGVWALWPTILFVLKLKKIKPDIIHLHNLHNSYINLPIFFKYIKKYNIKIVWTLHDCWAFTGQCTYFSIAQCMKWEKGCCSCHQYNKYPASKFDNTKKMWKRKKKWFTGIQNLWIVTPSQWLANLVKKSFLNEYPISVINNGIDLNVFKPIVSDYKKKIDISHKQYIILGVAYDWGIRKGLDIFIELSYMLDDCFQIILVGTTKEIDKKLPHNIISIHRTKDKEELIKIYTMADVFVNPTREEVLGMVNIEALACGTPVVTFNTDGSPEILNSACGIVTKEKTARDMKDAIEEICFEKNFSSDNCICRANEFDERKKYREYIKLYNRLIDKG